ncbi:uncharacterized protein LOC107274782 [Cephus cinctus]|uniref:Uncharacterized protein LOC107274782 n=1 Tax=Cephus cinctus TaxID=211228 RepID=A0AAJ7CFR3_CEPCN|nr:uncharacterized protein LOC107274782 [Cephus cinctus]
MVFYCTECRKALGKPVLRSAFRNETRCCDDCKAQHNLSPESPNYYLCIDIAYQIKMLLQDQDSLSRLLENINTIENRNTTEDLSIWDIHDGELYWNISKEYGRRRKLLTLSVSTDGGVLFHNSKLGFWPLQITINELPVDLRFKNVMIAALWTTETEPKSDFMNLYMSKFLKNLMRARVTVYSNIDQLLIEFKFLVLLVSTDSVARPIVQNRMQFNAFQGCSWCYIHGRHIGGSMRYPMMEIDRELRSHESHHVDVKDAKQTKKPIR